MASVESVAPEQLDFVGSLLVADTRAFVEAWREVLGGDPSAASVQIGELRERSKTLQLRARAAGVGGLAHHLGLCNEYADAADRVRLEQCLGNVLELAWQLSQEVERGRPEPRAASAVESLRPVSEAPPVQSVVQEGAQQSAVAPPPLLPWRGWKGLTTGGAHKQSTAEPEAERTPGVASKMPPTVLDAREASIAPASAPAVAVASAPDVEELASRPSVEAVSAPVDSAQSMPAAQAAGGSEIEAEADAPPTVREPSPMSRSADGDSSPGAVPEALAAPVPPPPLVQVQEAVPAQKAMPAQTAVPVDEPVLADEEVADAPISEPAPSSRSVFSEPVLESGWADEAVSAAALSAEGLSAEAFSAEAPSAAALSAEPFPLRRRSEPPRAASAASPEGLSSVSLDGPVLAPPAAAGSVPAASAAAASLPAVSAPAAERVRPGPPRPPRVELTGRSTAPAAPRVEAPPPPPPELIPLPQPVSPPARLDQLFHAPEPTPPRDGVAAPGEVLGLEPALDRLPPAAEPGSPGQPSSVAQPPGVVAQPPSVTQSPSSEPPSSLVQPPSLVAPPSPASLFGPAAPRLAPEPLPPFAAEASAEEELTEQELEIRLERVRRAAPFPLAAPFPPAAPFPLARGEVAIDLPPPSEPGLLRRPPRGRLWWMTPLALGVLGGVALLALLLRPWRQDSGEQQSAPQAVTRNEALLPVQRLTDDREVRLTLLALVQGGGKESSELSDLIREEVALVSKALVEPCAPGSPSCRIAEQARQMLAQPLLQKQPARAPAPPSGWLEGLRQPLIGVKDDPRVQKLVDYHTSDPVGRELFQGLLFRCGAYQGPFSDALMQHGLPLDLIAVPMVESGCVLDAESPVGARGLWQFMPATARAYHLRVQAGVLDERLNPAKSTDAALAFLRDLRAKLGSWELAFASYNMGPFALISRMNQAGPGTDYWDLVDAQRLPQETAGYVPKIQAFALILANLERFHFDAAQQMLGAASSPMSVPAGTRLGQVARAVGSSASRIRELNPDIIADIVPGDSGEEFSLRVPSDGAPRAREALERLLAHADDADECVPANFDWGKQRLTKAMLTRCKR